MGATCVVVLGSARVYGDVHMGDEARTPVEGVTVYLGTPHVEIGLTKEQRAALRPLQSTLCLSSSTYAVTDANGHYELRGLAAGIRQLGLNGLTAERDRAQAVPKRYLMVALEPAESRRIDFPPMHEREDSAVFRGRVVDGRGDAVATTDFWMRKATLRIASADRAGGLGAPSPIHPDQRLWDERTSYRPDGSFRVVLPAGRYDVWISSPNNERETQVIEDGALCLEAGSVVEMELTLPGATLLGQFGPSLASYLEKAVAPSSEGDVVRAIGAYQPGRTGTRSLFAGGVQDDGSFRLYGLRPGAWIVTGAARRARLEVTVPEGSGVVQGTLIPR